MTPPKSNLQGPKQKKELQQSRIRKLKQTSQPKPQERQQGPQKQKVKPNLQGREQPGKSDILSPQKQKAKTLQNNYTRLNNVPRETLSIIGTTIKSIREQLQLSLVEVAARSGVSRVTISNLESGRLDNASFESIFKIANVLHKTISFTIQ